MMTRTNRFIKPTEPLPPVYQAIGAHMRGEKYVPVAQPPEPEPEDLEMPFKVRAMRWLVVLAGGGPAVLFFADRVAHACGFCLGF